MIFGVCAILVLEFLVTEFHMEFAVTLSTRRPSLHTRVWIVITVGAILVLEFLVTKFDISLLSLLST